ncbi:MAG: hypothetical protein ACI9JT_000737 [Polaribacter sp.]|jgi:hypothetical protein
MIFDVLSRIKEVIQGNNLDLELRLIPRKYLVQAANNFKN